MYYFQLVWNYGVSGVCVSNGTAGTKDDLNYRNEAQYAQAIKSHPHVVILQFGTNDMMHGVWNEESFVINYSELISKFRGLASKPTVYLITPPPMYCDEKVKTEFEKEDCGERKENNDRLNTAIQKVITKNKIIKIDAFSAMGGKELKRKDLFTEDNLHPNDLGYTSLAHTVAFVMSQNEDFEFISKNYHATRNVQKKR